MELNDNKDVLNFHLTKKHIFWFLAALVLSGTLVRFAAAYHRVHYFDLSFYVDWSAGAVKDLFGVYENVSNLDYPPLFIFPLYITGKLLEIPWVYELESFKMLALKGWQMLFDIATIPLLYLVLRRHSKLAGLVAASLWTVNPTIIMNSSYWGQTDSIMIFLLLLAFFLLTGHKPVWSGIVMTLACLMKFQSLYFAPLYALYLLTSYRGKKIGQTITAGAGVAIGIFAPFMMRSGWKLPFEIYMGGFEQYPAACLNAFNYYGANGLNYEYADVVLFGNLTAENLSMMIIGLSLMMLLFFYFTASEKSVWLLGFIFMQTIFMFTTRMHERYQIPVLAFGLIACFIHKSLLLFISYMGITVITFISHFIVMENMISYPWTTWMEHYDMIIIVMSMINLAVYLITLWISVRILYRHGVQDLVTNFLACLPKKKLTAPIVGPVVLQEEPACGFPPKLE